jgi:hypothetical protein
MASMGVDPVTFGIMDNAKQTVTILEGQRANADIIERNGQFNTQNLNQIGGTLRDAIEHNGAAGIIAIEKNGSMVNNTVVDRAGMLNSSIERNGSSAVTATERTANSLGESIADKTNLLSHAIERIGGDNLTATERTASMLAVSLADKTNLLSHSVERIGNANLTSTERNAGVLGVALERVGAANTVAIERANNNMNIVGANILSTLDTGFKENMVETLKSAGDSKLFVATQVQGLDKQIGSYFQQGQRDVGRLETDLAKIENSLGRVADNHYASSQIELLKTAAILDKNTDRIGADLARQNAENFAKTQLELSKLELSLAKQAAENHATNQIEAAKNRMGIEQKILEVGHEVKNTLFDVKTTVLNDGFTTKRLFDERNIEHLRDNLSTEKIIHGMHHHHGHGHGYHGHYGHHGHHGHHGHGYGYPNGYGWGEGGPQIINDLRSNYQNRDNVDGRRRDDGPGGNGGGGGNGIGGIIARN